MPGVLSLLLRLPVRVKFACLFTLIPGLPEYTVGIVARGKITEDDYTKVLAPALRDVSVGWKSINLLLVMETGLRNFSAAAWLQDIKINLA